MTATAKRMSKREAQLRHAANRALERYGLYLQRADIQWIVDEIQAGRGASVRQTNRTSVVNLQYRDGPRMRVVYDRQRKTIVSFLPFAEAQ